MGCEKYSLERHGNMAVSDNFKVREFRCKSGADEIRVDTALVAALERIRALFGGAPVTIISGYRTQEYNAKVGGAPASQHLLGRAADIQIAGFTPDQVADRITRSRAAIGVGGIGRYNGFTHVDVGRPREWDLRTTDDPELPKAKGKKNG